MDAQTDENSWPMLAANPERTSWTPEEVRGRLKPVWYRPIEPYINPKTQVIAANGLLYISTAGGLYALDAENGDVAWVYPTELPLGHSPTVVGNILYVGGYDRKIYAINAVPDLSTLPRQQGYRINNQTIWVFDEAEAGFETNPLVVDGRLYAGNRDGYLYALNAATGELLWKFKTDGPILFSCAYKDGVLYFASNDSHAYAVSTDGRLIWKSAKLPGAGFHAYWPVIYTNPQTKRTYVVLGGSENYSDDNNSSGIGVGSLGNSLDNSALYVDSTGARLPDGALVGAVGTEPGDWAAQTVTIDASRIAQYLESNTGSDDNDSSNGLNKPWRRTYFVLDALTGHEFTFDSDGDGKPEYAPIAWLGTHSGNRYPAVIGSDGILYQANSYIANQYIPRGGISGWKFGTQFISRVHDGNYGAVDEPLAYSAGGNLIYWSLCCDREAGGYDITIPYGTKGRYWEYWDYNLGTLCPGLAGDCSAYGGQNGVYGAHGTVNPPIPYRGRLYKIASNAVIALGPEGGAVALGMVPTIDTQDKAEPIPAAHLKQLLAEEIQKMIDAGHLRPGYYSSVLGEWHLAGANWNFLTHYFHNPGETFYTLARAIPHLPWTLQQKAKDYLQQEYESYSQYNHIGWKNGAAREILDAPPEVQARMSTTTTAAPSSPYVPPERRVWEDCYRYYGMWKYAQVFGTEDEVYRKIKYKLPATAMTDQQLLDHPYAHNAYIAGYWAYLELEKAAGYPESSDVRAELERLLQLRVEGFGQDLLYGWEQPLSIAANFMYLTPELAEYLRDHALPQVRDAVDECGRVAPYWFVSRYDATRGEGALQVLFDYNAIFQAKALILQEPYDELVRYLDVPAFARGDLFYIQNLVAAIEASEKQPSSDVPLTYSIELTEGWNLISFPLIPVNGTVGDVFSAIGGACDQVCVRAQSSAGDTWECYNSLSPSQETSALTLDHTQGIWVYATEATSLAVEGSAPAIMSIPLRAGWNLVGYPGQSARPIEEALAGIEDVCELVYAYDPSRTTGQWQSYKAGNAPVLNSLKELKPGNGYWLKVKQDCVWTVLR